MQKAKKGRRSTKKMEVKQNQKVKKNEKGKSEAHKEEKARMKLTESETAVRNLGFYLVMFPESCMTIL